MPHPAASFNVSLPPPLRTFVKGRLKGAGFANTSEYVRHLIREDQAHAEERFRELAEEGLSSGPPVRMTAAQWADFRDRLIASREKRKIA